MFFPDSLIFIFSLPYIYPLVFPYLKNNIALYAFLQDVMVLILESCLCMFQAILQRSAVLILW